MRWLLNVWSRFWDEPDFQVVYDDGQVSRPLHWHDAKARAAIYKGKVRRVEGTR